MHSTATTSGARDHARAQEHHHDPSAPRPVVPATLASGLPPGVPAAAVVWEEVLGPGGATSRELARGTRVRLTDLDGDACASILCFNAAMPSERLCVADTVKVQWQAYPRAGTLLLSDLGRVLATIVEDTSARHDALCGPSNRAGNDRRYGDGSVAGPAPNARDRFLVAVAKHGLGARDVHPCLNLFKGVHVEPDGTLRWLGEPTAPGLHVELRCELPILLVVVNAPHVLDDRPRYTCTRLRITAWRGEPAGADDPVRHATPEARRAFENTEEYLRARGDA